MLGSQFTFAFGCMEPPAVQRLVERVEKGELDRAEAIRRIPAGALQRVGASDLVRTLMAWAAGSSRLSIRTAVDRPGEGLRALIQGAEGLGPCRLESLFLDAGRIERMREMIRAADGKGRERALARLLPLVRADLVTLLRTALTRPVTLSLLALPLSAFLPGEATPARAEAEPLEGQPSCRLGIVYPELTAMQARAILEAAGEVLRRDGVLPRIEIQLPPVTQIRELRALTRVIRQVHAEVEQELGQPIPCALGVSLTLERAAQSADVFAQEIDFLSLAADTPHREAKGALLARAMRKLGKLPRPVTARLVSGQEDPTNLVRLCHALGLASFACPPAQVPVARWAAAQAALENAGDSPALPSKRSPRARKSQQPQWMV